jgi:hypothetical protein
MDRVGIGLILLSGAPLALFSWSWLFALAGLLLGFSGFALWLLAKRSVPDDPWV